LFKNEQQNVKSTALCRVLANLDINSDALKDRLRKMAADYFESLDYVPAAQKEAFIDNLVTIQHTK
jgi:hypothetical protein